MSEEEKADLYALLNLSREVGTGGPLFYGRVLTVYGGQATAEEIKTAYRQLSMLYHPDKHTDPELRMVRRALCLVHCALCMWPARGQCGGHCALCTVPCALCLVAGSAGPAGMTPTG